MRGGRRSRFDPFGRSDAPTWLVVRDAAARLLEAHELPPGADTRLTFVCAALRWMSEGWLVEDFGPGTSVFFCSKDGRRVSVDIARVDPITQPMGEGRQSMGAWPR